MGGGQPRCDVDGAEGEWERRSEIKWDEVGGSGSVGDSPLLLEKAPGADVLFMFSGSFPGWSLEKGAKCPVTHRRSGTLPWSSLRAAAHPVEQHPRLSLLHPSVGVLFLCGGNPCLSI